MRGFQKGITLGGGISGSVNLVDLQKWVAKKFAKLDGSRCQAKAHWS